MVSMYSVWPGNATVFYAARAYGSGLAVTGRPHLPGERGTGKRDAPGKPERGWVGEEHGFPRGLADEPIPDGIS